VLHEFLATNRTILIDRCRCTVAGRSEAKSTEHELAHGIPVFLDQVISTLIAEQHAEANPNGLATQSKLRADAEVGQMAMLHGRDLLQRGFTLEQVVRDYGDVCQAVTNLAFETGAPIGVDEFRTFNRCLDNAIAGAVTEYAKHSAEVSQPGVESSGSRLGPLAHELRNYLNTATLVVAAIKMGSVGISGATGAVLDRSLLGMRTLIDRTLAEARVAARMPPRQEIIQLSKFLEDVRISASFDAVARRTPFTMAPVDPDISVYADAEMLAAAVGNLLQNAFKFTKSHTHVKLQAYASGDRVLIDVEDHCGGLAHGAAEKMFSSFPQSSADRSGLGLGIDISRRGVEANRGVLRVRDIPDTGCVFTIDLPRCTPN
jgi:signal transduction histidine kinase